MYNKVQILLLVCFPFWLHAQTGKRSLTLQEASELMNNRNPTLRMADKEAEEGGDLSA